MAGKPSIPSGTRDFSPQEVYKRRFLFDTIRNVFEKYGFRPIETPVMENLSVLEGKYGDEGDRLLYRILNSGNIVEAINSGDNTPVNNAAAIAALSSKGLRYDLTIPFARYVVMHRNEITLPFRRYQMQPVFRADRPQRGRYREFFQCDADVVGSDSLVNEAELLQIYDEVFSLLKMPVSIRLNNRKVLAGLAETIQATDKFIPITVAIDKLDKTGIQGVRQELASNGITESQMQVVEKFLSLQGDVQQQLDAAKNLFATSETGMKGLTESEQVLELLAAAGETINEVTVDFTLARGLNYYTGTIVEVKPLGVQMGSVGGGGRYDDLTGVFGLKGVSGVGISFGADRIYDVMEAQQLFPSAAASGTKALFIIFDEASVKFALPWLKKLRAAGIAAEIYPDAAKLKKQMSYADDNRIPFVIFAGENERAAGRLTLRNMENGEQQSLSPEEIIERLK